jgi:hypothetical protein
MDVFGMFAPASLRCSGRGKSGLMLATVMVAMTVSASGAESRREAQEVLRLALTEPRFVKYLNFDATPVLRVANRTPLDFGKLNFSVQGHEVEVIPPEAADPRAVEITRAEVGPESANLALRYRQQGIRVQVTFAKRNAQWSVDQFSLVEN